MSGAAQNTNLAAATSGVVPLAGSAGYSGDPKVDIDKHIGVLTNKVLGYFITAVLFWFIGTALGVFWSLHGSVSALEAKSSISREIDDYKIDELKEKNKELQEKVYFLECMNNKSIRNKSECHQ